MRYQSYAEELDEIKSNLFDEDLEKVSFRSFLDIGRKEDDGKYGDGEEQKSECSKFRSIVKSDDGGEIGGRESGGSTGNQAISNFLL